MEFELKSEYIELIKLLKLMGVADNGGEAKSLVDASEIKVNKEIENRKRRKLVKNDIVTFGEINIYIK